MAGDEEEERAFPVTFKPYREEQDQPEPVDLPEDRDDPEGPLRLPPVEDEDETLAGYPVTLQPDALLDEPEWSARNNSPEITLKDFLRPWDTGPENQPGSQREDRKS